MHKSNTYFIYIIIVLSWYPMKSLDQGLLWDDVFESMHFQWELCLREEISCSLCLWLYYLPMKSDHYHLIYELHLRGSYAMTWSMKKCIFYHYISCYVHHYVFIQFSSWVESNWGIKWCPVKPRAPVNGVDKIQVDDQSKDKLNIFQDKWHTSL